MSARGDNAMLRAARGGREASRVVEDVIKPSATSHHELRGQLRALGQAEWKEFSSLHLERRLPGLTRERQGALARELRSHPWSQKPPLLVHQARRVAVRANPSKLSFINLWSVLGGAGCDAPGTWRFDQASGGSAGWTLLEAPSLMLCGDVNAHGYQVGAPWPEAVRIGGTEVTVAAAHFMTGWSGQALAAELSGPGVWVQAQGLGYLEARRAPEDAGGAAEEGEDFDEPTGLPGALIIGGTDLRGACAGLHGLELQLLLRADSGAPPTERPNVTDRP